MNKFWYILPIEQSLSRINSNSKNQTIAIKNEEYNLNINDIIKLGRVKYAVNEIKTNFYNINKIDNTLYDINKQEEVYDIKNINNGTEPVFNFIYEADHPETIITDDICCKFCYSSLNDIANPLVNICSVCTGGLKYTHFECLKMFMKTKLIVKANHNKTVKSYNVKAFNCELCKTPFPCKKII